MSVPYLSGATIDFADNFIERQSIDNLNAQNTCGACGESFHWSRKRPHP